METQGFGFKGQFIGKHFVMLACLVFGMVVFLANQQWNFDLAKFVAVQVCFVYLPGYALQCLLRVSYVNKLSRWFVSYATGYALSVMSYVLLLVMRQQSHVVWLYVIVAIVSIGYLCRIYRKQGIAGFGQEPWQARENTIVGIILFVAFSIAFVSYQCANMSPRLLGGEVWYFPDLVFWMRNGVAATKSYPLPELSVSGNLFWYHYFSNLELAFLSLTTGIEMSDMVSVYYYPVYLILYVGGLYVVLKEVAQRQGIVYLGLCLVLFAFSLEKLTHVFFSGKVYGTSFGCVESLAFMCYALYFFFRMTREPEKRGLLLLLSLLMFLQCAGQKGPVAAVLLAGIVSWCAFVMVKRRERKWIMFVGTMFVSVFVLVSLLFIFGGVPHAEKGSTSEISISLVYTLYHSGVFLELCQKLNDIVGSYHLARMISMVLFVCSFMLIPLLALGSVMVSGHKAAGGGKRREEKRREEKRREEKRREERGSHCARNNGDCGCLAMLVHFPIRTLAGVFCIPRHNRDGLACLLDGFPQQSLLGPAVVRLWNRHGFVLRPKLSGLGWRDREIEGISKGGQATRQGLY